MGGDFFKRVKEDGGFFKRVKEDGDFFKRVKERSDCYKLTKNGSNSPAIHANNPPKARNPREHNPTI